MKSRREFLKMAGAGLAAVAGKALLQLKPPASDFQQGGIVPAGKPVTFTSKRLMATDVKIEMSHTGNDEWIDLSEYAESPFTVEWSYIDAGQFDSLRFVQDKKRKVGLETAIL